MATPTKGNYWRVGEGKGNDEVTPAQLAADLDHGTLTGLADDDHAQYLLVDGTRTATQINVDNLRLDGNAITSTDAAGDITITPDTTGDLILDALKWPQADGANLAVLMTNGAAQLSWQGSTGAGNIVRTASPTIILPTIASFLNAQHAHVTAATGGTLDAAAIAAGTLVHERGGLEADVSAYAGLVKITGGATSAATIGIADDNIVEVDGSPNSGEYARFTANGLEGRTVAELRAALHARVSLPGLDFNAFDFFLDATTPPRFDYAQNRAVLIFDQTTIDKAYTRARRMPSQYTGGTLEATILYSMVSDVSPKTVYFDVAVEATTPDADAKDLDVTSTFDTDNTGSATVPATTAGKLGEITVTLTNDDSVAAGDLVTFRLQTNTTGDAVGDSRVYAMEISEVLP
jgi:hypothetical protein